MFGQIAFKNLAGLDPTNDKKADDDWSEMELRSLRTLVASGAAVEEIAALTRRTHEQVLSKLVEMGLTVPQNSK